MKVIVNRALCDGNGNCAREAPEMFAIGEDDELEVLNDTFDDAYRAKAEAAVRSCPKNALRISD